MKKLFSLTAFLLIVFAVSAIGSWVTMPAIDGWYANIEKPAFNPPNYVFGPVWTLLYIMIAVSGWLVWNRLSGKVAERLSTRAMQVYAGQLLANFLWSIFFFGMQNPQLALVDIVLLLILIVYNIRQFMRIHKVAAYLLIPYLLWVSFASVLNASIVALN